MNCEELCERLDSLLDTAAYAEVDASANGLQVGPASQPVEHVAEAVDAAVETIDRARDAGADLLVTHHGVVWGGLDRVTGQAYRRIAPLVDDDLALYVSHLPLDGHQELGNAAGLADLLDLGNRAPFGTLGDRYVGQRGQTPAAMTAEEIREALAADLDTKGQSVRVLDFGPGTIRDVAIVTGSGADWLEEAAEAGADALVTGEGKGKLYHEAHEVGVTVFLAGHYATETVGVRALGGRLEEWGLETTFIDCPTGL